MSKKRFIQQVIIRSMPELNKLSQAIKYAEGLYEGLTQHGYGSDKGQPNENKDWYNHLTPRQRKWFTGFWNAFNYKNNRNGAAMRWVQLGELTDDDYRSIIDAAKKEANKQIPPGQARKMAQGWLHEKRYNDFLPSETKNKQKNHVLIRLNNELNGIKKLYESSQDEALLEQIVKIEEAIKNVRV